MGAILSNMKELIEHYIKENEYLNLWDESNEFINVENASQEMKKHIDYIRSKVNFIYGRDLCVEQPFVHVFVWTNGERSASFEDLTTDDVPKIKSLILNTEDCFLLGKLYDVIGILTNDNNYKVLAAHNLLLYFEQTFKTHPTYHVAEILKRSLFLWHGLKDHKTIENCIKDILEGDLYASNERKVVLLRVLSVFVFKYAKKQMSIVAKAIIDCYDDADASDVLLELAEKVINYFSSNHDEANCNIWRLKYKDTCCQLAEQRMNHGYDYYNKAIKHLDSEEHEDIINELRFKIDEAQESLYDSMNMQAMPITLPNDAETEFFNHKKAVVDSLKNAQDGLSQLVFLLEYIKPRDITSIEKEIAENKSSFLSFVNNIRFNKDKHIEFDSADASEDEKREYDIANSLRMHMWVQHELFIAPFVYYLKNDSTVIELLDDILGHNCFVSCERKEIIKSAFIKGFNKEIKEALFALLSQFEYGCRHYLKVHKRIHTTTIVGSMETPVDLNKMLVKKNGKTNKYRDAIQELVGESMTLSLEYLACRPLSGNIRNRNYHDGINKSDNYDLEEVFLFYYLFEAYCMGYDPDL